MPPEKAAKRRKDLIWSVRYRHLCELIRGLQNLDIFRKGNVFILFACTKRTQSTPEGCDPLDSGDGSKLYGLFFSRYFQLSSLYQYMVRPTFSDVLNRCKRVIVHQTQDCCYSETGCHTASSQGRMYSKRGAARYFCCGENLFLRCADWKF